MKVSGKDYKTTKKWVGVLVSPRTSRSTLMFDQALVRDGFRCMITGSFDRTSVDGNLEVQSLCKKIGGSRVVVQACHIVGEALMQGIGQTVVVKNKVCTIVESLTVHSLHRLPQRANAAGVLATLWLFGLENIVLDLERKDQIHETWNLLSLDTNIHYLFDRLDMWFEELSDKVRHLEAVHLCWLIMRAAQLL